MIFVHCPLCDNGDGKRLWNRDGADYYRCPECSLVYENPRLTDEELTRFYSREEYFINPSAARETSGYQDYLQQCTPQLCSEYFHIVSRLLPGQKGRLLDIGCGLGGMLQVAVKNGWSAAGLEISRWAAEYAKKSGLEVYEGDLIGMRFPDNSFDAISMFDVLEHLPRPGLYAREVHRILKPGGLLLAETPNVAGFFVSHLYRENSDMVKPRAHICLYSPANARQLFEGNGFSKVRIDTFPYCRRYTPGYFKNLLLSRIIRGRAPVQLTWNESLRIAAWK